MSNCRYIARLISGFVILVGPAVPMLAQDAGKAPAAAAATAEKSAATFKRVSDQARQYLVTHATRWQKSEGEYPTGASEDQYHRGMRDQVENRKADEAVGVMLDPVKGLIIAEDHGQQPRFIESEKAFTADGKPFALKRHGLCLDMDAALYQTREWPGPREPLAWLAGPLDLHGGPWTSASVSREAGFWRVTFAGGFGAKTMFRRTEASAVDEVIAEAVAALVFDAEGRPIGFSPGGRISLTGDRYPWRGTAYSAMRVMTWTEFGALRADIERRVAAYAHEVRIVYRQPEQGEEDLEFDEEEDDEESLTRYYYGYAISPTRVLVAAKLEKEHIQRFKTITVCLDDKDVPATFLGAYQHFGGFIVEMTGATSPGVLKADDATAVPDFNRAVLTYVHERKFGQRRNTVWYNRVSSYDRGYEDRLWPTLKRRAETGTLILDTAGKPVGLCLVERFLDKEKRGEDNGWYYDAADAVRLYPLSQLAAALAKPSDHFDANLKPATGQQGHRLVWLGVETQLLDSRLAEMLDRIAGGDAVQQATRSGEIGLRITYVHKNSPAAKVSLAEGDILLSITEEGKAKPIELTGDGDGGYWWGGYAPRSATGTQFERRNYLTRLLTRLGPGTKIELRYLSGDEVKTQAFVLQWSPPDYESADKYKDEKTGVTVKNLTYDIRAMLKLDGDQPGVIVAKAEPGEKAALAQIGGGVIITNINGEPLKSIKDYDRLIKGVQGNTDGGTAVLSLWSMGKSRRVKIEFP